MGCAGVCDTTRTLLLKRLTTQISQVKQHRHIYIDPAAAEHVKSEKPVARAEKIQFLMKVKGMMLFG